MDKFPENWVDDGSDEWSMVQAALRGDYRLVETRVSDGADVHAKGEAALRLAVRNGHFGIVEYLLDAGADPLIAARDMLKNFSVPAGSVAALIIRYLMIRISNIKSELVQSDDSLCLRIASLYGLHSLIKEQIQLGVNVSDCNDEALRLAVRSGNLAVAQELLRAGANVNAQDDEALSLAAASGHIDLVGILLSAGANPCARNYDALISASRNGYEQIVQAFLDQRYSCARRSDMFSQGVDSGVVSVEDINVAITLNPLVNSVPIPSENLRIPLNAMNLALREAAIRGHQRIVSILLHAGADALSAENFVTTCIKDVYWDDFIFEVDDLSLGVIEELVLAGASIRILCDEAIDIAIKTDNDELVESLLKMKAVGSDNGAAAFRWACAHNVPELATHLVSRSMAAEDALWIVVSNGYISLLKAILDENPDAMPRHPSLVVLAIQLGHLDIAKLLIASGWGCPATDFEAMHEATTNSDTDLVLFYIDIGADIFAEQHALLNWAIAKKNWRVIKRLVLAYEDALVDDPFGDNRDVDKTQGITDELFFIEEHPDFASAAFSAKELAVRFAECTGIERSSTRWLVLASKAVQVAHIDDMYEQQIVDYHFEQTADDGRYENAALEYQAEVDEELLDEFQSYQDDWARSENEGWYYDD